MKAMYHAKSSARHYGGQPGDYLDVHEFIDSSKEHVADVRHRALLHSSFGVGMVAKMFGSSMHVTKRHGKGLLEVSLRDIAERHILEDIGRIPSVQDWLDAMDVRPWMGGRKGRVREVSWADLGWNTEATFDKLEDKVKVEHELLKD